MNTRDIVFASIRRSLRVNGTEAPRRKEVTDRIAGHPCGVVPLRGQGDEKARLDLFVRMARAASAGVEIVSALDEVPAAIAGFLRQHNLPMSVRCGDAPLLAAVPWTNVAALEMTHGVSDGTQATSVSHAFAAVAETGTAVLISGRDNPTTLNFLPDNHVIVVEAADIAGDYESVWDRLRERFGPGTLPRAVNMITGPSRSADIGQKLLLGAHGPRRVHVLVVMSAETKAQDAQR